MADQLTTKPETVRAVQRGGRLSWILQPWAVFAPQPFMALGVLGALVAERNHVHYSLLALGLTLGVVLSGPPALVWLRVVDRLNAKYLQQPYREVISGSTWEQNAVSATAFVCAIAFLLINIWLSQHHWAGIADPSLCLGALIGAALVADGVYLSWYRRRARSGGSRP